MGYCGVILTPWFPFAWQNLQNPRNRQQEVTQTEASHPRSHGSSPLLTVLLIPRLLWAPTLLGAARSSGLCNLVLCFASHFLASGPFFLF